MNWEHYKKEIENSGVLDENAYILGIDLGTTNSVISYWNTKNGRPEVIDVSNGFGKAPLPSVVQYREEEGYGEEWVVGEEALNTAKIYPETTVQSVKRKMGTKSSIRLGGSDYLPEDLSAMILKTMVQHVMAMNPKMVLAGVVVSVPYDFDDSAKKATIKACHLAGLADGLICLIEEPKAAALAYNVRNELDSGDNVMVFDFGGGTLDITVFCVEHKDADNIHLKVISEGGEAYHGGDNVDDMMYQQLLEWYEAKTNQDRKDLTRESVSELFSRARETKERLSGVAKHRVPYTFCIPPFVQPVTREALETLIEPFRIKTKQLIQSALEDGYEGPIDPSDISRVLLEGGSSQMPWVRRLLSDLFGDDKIYSSEQPALDIALGAAYYGAMKLGVLDHVDLQTMDRRIHFETSVAHDIGFEIEVDGVKKFHPMIYRGTPYALARKKSIFTLRGEDEAAMSHIELRLMERLKTGDPLEACSLVGELNIKGLPVRPSGKTQLAVSLWVDQEGGTIEGEIEDLGYEGLYPASGFCEKFSPERNRPKVIQA